MGAESKLKAGEADDKEGKPPADSGTARSAGNQPSKPPAGTRFPQEKPVPPGFSTGDARGEAPCIK